MKKNECPECGSVFDISEWNKATADEIGCELSQIESIDDDDKNCSWYFCPACKTKIDGERIEEVAG